MVRWGEKGKGGKGTSVSVATQACALVTDGGGRQLPSDWEAASTSTLPLALSSQLQRQCHMASMPDQVPVPLPGDKGLSSSEAEDSFLCRTPGDTHTRTITMAPHHILTTGSNQVFTETLVINITRLLYLLS